VHSLRRGAAEAIEVVAHGAKESSKVVGRRICDIYLPSGTTIGAIVRDKEVLIAHDEVMVQADDHIILFVVDKKQITSIEKLFQVGLKLF
jgi:trk system potassium uptake protein TrkA